MEKEQKKKKKKKKEVGGGEIRGEPESLRPPGLVSLQTIPKSSQESDRGVDVARMIRFNLMAYIFAQKQHKTVYLPI